MARREKLIPNLKEAIKNGNTSHAARAFCGLLYRIIWSKQRKLGPIPAAHSLLYRTRSLYGTHVDRQGSRSFQETWR